MADMIRDNMGWMNDQFKNNASRLLTYRRANGIDQVQILMTVGSKPVPQFSVLGSTPGALDPTQADPKNAVRSFSFACADLDFGLNDGQVTPEEATKLSAYLQMPGFISPDKAAAVSQALRVDVVLGKEMDTMVVSFFVDDAKVDDEKVTAGFAALRQQISQDVFGNQKVIIQLCDPKVRLSAAPVVLNVKKTIR